MAIQDRYPLTRPGDEDTISRCFRVGDQASARIVDFLARMQVTVAVTSVENDELYRARGIDLIHHYRTSRGVASHSIEIKGDTHHTTGNLFLETESNAGRARKGCFLTMQADWLFYHFVHSGRLLIIPLAKARAWFVANQGKFKECTTGTRSERGNRYWSKGRVVPIWLFKAHVPEIIDVRVDEGAGEEIFLGQG